MFAECGGKNFHFIHESADIGKVHFIFRLCCNIVNTVNGFEPTHSKFRVHRSNHSITLLPLGDNRSDLEMNVRLSPSCLQDSISNCLLVAPKCQIFISDTAVNCTIRSAYGYGGQKCSACSRMYVPESKWGQVCCLASVRAKPEFR